MDRWQKPSLTEKALIRVSDYLGVARGVIKEEVASFTVLCIILLLNNASVRRGSQYVDPNTKQATIRLQDHDAAVQATKTGRFYHQQVRSTTPKSCLLCRSLMVHLTPSPHITLATPPLSHL